MTDKKVWFITGAGRGMGVDITQAARAAGHAVVATGRNSGAVTDAVGEAHVASPLQNVELLALVPLFKFPTGRFPVTPLVRSTCAHAGLFVVPVLDK